MGLIMMVFFFIAMIFAIVNGVQGIRHLRKKQPAKPQFLKMVIFLIIAVVFMFLSVFGSSEEVSEDDAVSMTESSIFMN